MPRFDAGATAREVVAGLDLAGRTAIVTGGYSGIGLETTFALHGAGADVLVPARDVAKARARLAATPGVRVEPLDLSDPVSIRGFAASYLDGGRALDILVNNAGVASEVLAHDARGCETHFATNHLGHFQLVEALWPALRAAGGARVVNVSAWAHRIAPIDFDDPMFERRDFSWLFAYGQSKTANVLHAVDISDRGGADGIDAFAVHPGAIIGTGLIGWASPEMYKATGAMDERGERVVDPERGKKTPEQGASTQTWLATDPALAGVPAFYAENNERSTVVDNCDIDGLLAELGKGMTPPGVAAHALDPELAQRLRELSLRLVPPSP